MWKNSAVRATVLLFVFSSLVLADYTTLDIGSKRSITSVTLTKQKHIEIPLKKSMLTQIKGGSEYVFLLLGSQNGAYSYTIFGQDPALFTGKELRQNMVVRGEVFPAEPAHLIIIDKTSPVWRDLEYSRTLFIRLDAKAETVTASVDYMISDSVELPLGTRCTAQMDNLEKLKLKTSVTRFLGNHHMKFMFEAKTHKGAISLSGYGLKGDKEPTSGNKNFDLIRFDSDKIGYVIDQADPLYCQEGACTYSMVVRAKNVGQLDIYFGEHMDQEPLNGKDHTVVCAEPDRLHKRELGQSEHLHVPSPRDGRDHRVHACAD